MNIGYACLAIDVPNSNYRSCILRTASEENLREITRHNLKTLDTILDYNRDNNILLYRITSDLIPFGSSPVNTTKWWESYRTELEKIGNKITEYGMRVSMHPGQYTVLNSPKSEVVERAVKDLEYHCLVLDSLRLGENHKIILHIGGVYGDKEQAMKRFITEYHSLSQSIRNRLVIENDDKQYNIRDVLEISAEIHAPVIFDNLHHQINPCEGDKDEIHWIEECRKTWMTEDGVQKIHYSQQHPVKKPGSHSDTIDVVQFREFCRRLNREDIDIMLEVKDKNLSVMKCQKPDFST